MEALSRRYDPLTSHLAADRVEGSGNAQAQRQTCLAAVRRWPGLTAAEIAVKCGLERHVPSRRLPELRADGLVMNRGKRRCEATGNLSMTWQVVTRQGMLWKGGDNAR
jgi:CRP-like cAMP-binding protein